MLLLSGATSAEVYHWTAQSGDWEDRSNWEVNGQPARHLPGAEDYVVVSAVKPTVIALNTSATIASLTVAGEASVHFKTYGPAELQVKGHFYLTKQTTVDSGIQFQLSGGPGSRYTALYETKDAISFANEQNYEVAYPLASSMASCAFFTLVPEVTNPTCNGSSDGVAGVEVPVDGIGPFTYQWVGGPTTRLWSGVGAGTYTVIVIDEGQGGLPCSEDIFVNEPGPLTVFSMNGTAPTCATSCDGEATPVIIGGNGGYELTWSSGETGPMAAALCATFTLEVEDQLGCLFSTDFTFPDTPDPITSDAVVADIVCFGDGDGSIDAMISGGTGAYTYSWSGPGSFSSASPNISGLDPGQYTLTVTDANLCEEIFIYDITEVPEIAVSETITDNQCAGDEEGAIAIVVTGGTAPYTFSWLGPGGFTSAQQDLTDLGAGTYSLNLIDDNGCNFSDTYEVQAPEAIVVDIATTDVPCSGEATGTADASASQGTAPYSYAWIGPNEFTANGPSISGLEAGVYDLEVTDGNGCAVHVSVSIDQPSELTLDVDETPISCVGSADGQLSVAPAGGVAPYTYSWTGPGGFTSDQADVSGLSPGNYVITVSDANGCTIVQSVELTDPAPISVISDTTPPTCAGGSDGAITIAVSGGTEPYTFGWSGPLGFSSGSQDLIDVIAGTYSLLVTDDAGCTGTFEVTLSNPDDLDASFDIADATCFGASDGSIAAAPFNGTAPYSYLWIGPGGFFSTDQNIDDLQAGTYTLQLTDANGCARFLEVIVAQPAQIQVTRVITNATCFGSPDGAINISAGGGTPPYTFNWSGPDGFTATSEDITGVVGGAYTVAVTDVNGCERVRIFTVGQPAEIVFDGNVTNATCAGDDDGAIALNLVSGAGPFTFAWTGPGGFSATTQDISTLFAGSYTVTATNGQGCSGEFTFEVEESVIITLSASIENVTCFGEGDGAIDLTIDGGIAPIVIAWAGPDGYGSDQANLAGLEPGTYSVAVTDDFGCEVVDSFEVLSPAILEAVLDATNISCADEVDGSITAAITGGNPPYTLLWTGPDGFTADVADLSGLQAGSYNLAVEDSLGCTVSAEVNIIEPETLSLTVDAVEPACLDDDGSLTAIVAGGTIAADYTYTWTDGGGNVVGTTATIDNLAPGTFAIVVEDDNGCTANQSIQLFRESINLSALATNVSCAGGNDGTLSVTPQSGTSPFVYSWNGPGGFTSDQPAITDLAAGQYTLTVSDAAGCVLNEAYDINEPLPISISADILPEGCPGAVNGQITLALSGGTPGFLIAWTGPEGYTGTGATATGLVAGAYQVLVTDVNGCEQTAEWIVGVADEIEITLDSVDPACAGQSTGSITTAITGGEAPLNFEWTGPDGFTAATADIADIASGTYLLLVTDAAGCEATADVTLVEADPIELDLLVQGASCLLSNGSAEVTATGGTGELTYEWTDPDGNVISVGVAIVDVPSGVYGLQVTDGVGCTETVTIPISDTDADIVGEAFSTSCPEGDDGAVNIEVVGGTPPFSYAWSGPGGFSSTEQNIADLIQGTYVVAVTDSNSCVYAADFEVTDPAALLLSADVGLVTCNGDDGSIALVVSGGTPGYAIDWSGPDGFVGAGNDLDGLIPGTYVAELVDANGCLASNSFDVGLVPEISVTADLTSPLCGDANDGTLDIDITGGTPPYAVLWAGPDGFESSETMLINLAGGTYELTIVDFAGCEFTEVYVLDQPEILQISLDAVAPDCGEENGSITATLSGGVVAGSYFINWSNAAGDNLGGANPLESIGPGLYTITVVDDNGCELSESFDLSNPGISVTAEVVDVTCSGGDDGSIALVIMADNPPVEVLWTGPGGFTANTADIDALVPGEYTYVATAADGCEVVGTLAVGEPPAISAEATINPTCFGEENGSISLVLSDAEPEVAVVWTGPDGFSSEELLIGDLAPGVYQIQVTDASGCTFSAEYEVPENNEIILSLDAVDATCAGGFEGAVVPTVAGGTPPYQYNWSGPDGYTSDEETITGLAAGTYLLLLTDAVGCTLATDAEIGEPSAIDPEAIVIFPECDNPGGLSSILLEINGGTAPYSVSWTGPDGFVSNDESIFDVPPGDYSFTITDALGCTVDDVITISEILPLSATAEVTDATCFGVADGAIEVEASGGIAPIIASWTGPNGFETEGFSIDQLEAGSYVLLLTDSLGCTLEASYEVGAPDAIAAEAGEVTDASCNTSFDGALSVIISGGTAPYTVNWSGPNDFEGEGESINDLEFGIYTAEISDANGCTSTVEMEVDFILEITASAGDDLALCQSVLPFDLIGLSEGADVFFWSDEAGGQLSSDAFLTLDGLEPGVYIFLFQAANGICTASDTVEVEILPLPEADAGPDFDVFIEEVFMLGGNPTSPTAVSYEWSPSALGDFDSSAPNPTGFLTESTTFVLTVTDENGCVAIDSVRVSIIPSVVISSGFTPNDDGVNDVWIIDNIELFSNSLVSVFNRWGQLVYRQRAYNAGNAWDGTYEGSQLPIGTYYYTIELNDPRFPEPFTGPITIYR